MSVIYPISIYPISSKELPSKKNEPWFDSFESLGDLLSRIYDAVSGFFKKESKGEVESKGELYSPSLSDAPESPPPPPKSDRLIVGPDIDRTKRIDALNELQKSAHYNVVVQYLEEKERYDEALDIPFTKRTLDLLKEINGENELYILTNDTNDANRLASKTLIIEMVNDRAKNFHYLK